MNAAKSTKTDLVKLVTFRLGEDEFAADIFAVEGVLRYAAPTAVPDAPPWVSGVLKHRGTVLPVVDMRLRIGLPGAAATAETRIVVLTTASGWVGAIVDAVHEVAAMPAASVAAPPPLFRGLASQFLVGLATVRERLVVILDADRVLSSVDRIAFEQALQSANAPPDAVVVNG